MYEFFNQHSHEFCWDYLWLVSCAFFNKKGKRLPLGCDNAVKVNPPFQSQQGFIELYFGTVRAAVLNIKPAAKSHRSTLRYTGVRGWW